jgi:hypothetical protein
MPDNISHQQSSLDLSSITEDFLNSPEVTGAQAATPVQAQQEEVTPPVQEEVTPPLQATETPQTPELPTDPQEQQRGYLRDSDYRQKTMRLAEEKRAFEAEKQQIIAQLQKANNYAQQLHQQVHDPAYLQAQWNRLHAQVQAQDPNAPVSAQVVNQLLQEQVAKSEQKVAQYIHQLEVQRNAAQFDQERALYAQTLLKEYPTLEDQDGIERLISEAAWKRGPANMNELKQFMKEDAEARHKRVQKRIDDNAQAAIMRQAKAQKPGIEPKGGSVPVLQTPQRKLKLGSQDLFNDTVEWLKNQG